MRQGAPRIGAEILVLGLIVGGLAGAVGLVASASRRGADRPPVRVVEAPALPSKVDPAPEPDPEPDPEPIPPPAPPVPDDPTPGIVADLLSKAEAEVSAAEAAHKEAEARESAIAAAQAEAEKWRRREEMVSQKLASLDREARRVEDEADALARERDILAEKRDEAKESLKHAQLRAKDGLAVLPYKGPNGTWRRPIAIECHDGLATLQPGGPSYSVAQIALFARPRSHPLVQAVAKMMIRGEGMATPDGAPSVPYILFVIRPDGIAPYYAARALLDPLGLVQGYELVDADWDIEYPDLGDPKEWKGLKDSGAMPSPSWPPPDAGNDLAQGAGGDRLGDLRATGPGGLGGLGGPTGGPGGREGGGGRGNSTASDEKSGGWGSLNGRAFPSPGDGHSSDIDLNELARGRGAGLDRVIPDDGRVPVIPGGVLGMDENEADPTLEQELSRAREGLGLPPSQSRPSGSSPFPGAPGARPEPPRRLAVPSRMVPAPFGGASPPAADRPIPPIAAAGSGAGSRPGTSAGSGRSAQGDGAPPTDPDGTPLNATTGHSQGPTVVRGPAISAPPRTAPSTGTTTTAGGAPPATNPAGAVGGTAGSGASSTGSTASTSSSSSSGKTGTGTSVSGTSSGVPIGPPGGGGGQSGGQGGTGPSGPPDSKFQSKSFEIFLSCGPNGVTVHPGNHVLTRADLEGNDLALPGRIHGLIQDRWKAEPEVGWRSKLHFLIKPGGEGTYLRARTQILSANMGLPMTFQLAGTSPIKGVLEETRR